MKTHKLLLSILIGIYSILPASAQYSDIVNGITNALMPALSGNKNYKGFIETDYTQGFGNYRTNFATVSTTQGYQFNNWFYMGAGIGVDVFWSQIDKDWGDRWKPNTPNWEDNSYTNGAVMIPIFTDFRFSAGDKSQVSFFGDIKVGASFLCSSSYVKIRNGYLTNTTYFYLQPSIGVRIPINKTHPRQALNIGVHYRIITSNYWSGYQSTVPLNGVGGNISFEW